MEGKPRIAEPSLDVHGKECGEPAALKGRGLRRWAPRILAIPASSADAPACYENVC